MTLCTRRRFEGVLALALLLVAGLSPASASDQEYEQLLSQCHANAAEVASGVDLPPSALQPCEQAIEAEGYLRQLEVAIADWQAQNLRVNHGLLLAEMGFLDKALASYNQALAYSADPASLYLNRATLYLYRGDFEAALADLQYLVARPDFRARALYNRALVQHYAGMYLPAQDDFNALAAEYPQEYEQWMQNEELRAIYPVQPVEPQPGGLPANSALPGSSPGRG